MLRRLSGGGGSSRVTVYVTEACEIAAIVFNAPDELFD